MLEQSDLSGPVLAQVLGELSTDREALDVLRNAIARLVALDTETASQEHVEGVPALRFDPAAQQLFDEWRFKLEGRIRGGEFRGAPAFEAHISKYRGLTESRWR